MVSPNWALTQQPNSFEQAFGLGQHLGQQAKQANVENALAQYAVNPDAPEAFENLAKNAPQLAMRERQNMEARQAEAQKRQLIAAAVNGDANAKQQLLGVDYDTWSKLDKNTRDKATQNAKILGEAARYADTPEKWDQTIDALAAQGLDVSKYRGQFSPENRMAAIISGQQLDEYNKQMEPGIEFIPNDAVAYATNPQGEQVLQAMQGQSVQPGPQGGGISKEEGEDVVLGWNKAGYATRDQIEIIKQSMGGNQQAVDAYLRKNNIPVIDADKTVNGQTYYKINGQWFDNVEGR